ncbi:hypothetical protein B7486_05450 [cyanobacterium TDX16]|nr:hypothetical protein B7486_05450 [cyanobacterium TDX16]
MSANPIAYQTGWIARSAPHRLGGSTVQDIIRSWTLAGGIVGLFGTLLFGVAAAKVLLVAMVSAVLTDFIAGYARGRGVVGGLSHAALTGLLLGLTLPATVAWYVPTVGAAVAVIFGKVVFGGFGHYFWQPALVGRVVVQLVFLPSLALGSVESVRPVLAPGHLLVGRLESTQEVSMAGYRGWQDMPATAGNDALSMPTPLQSLRAFAEGKVKPDGDLVYTPLVRDMLPPWEDTIFGTIPGGIGETCVLALLVGGLYLIYRGFIRWQLPATMFAAAFLAAGLLPVEYGGAEGGYDWFPIFAVENGRAVGLAYVMYHLTSGGLMLGAFLLAGDMVTTPMRASGQIIFAAGVGTLTIFMRLYGVAECACYWSILILNTLVMPIDRQMKRTVLGVEEV